MSNQRRVWEEEKKALEERKRIDQMIKERQEERQILELQQMQEAAGGKKRVDRVNWMYNGPSDGQTGTTEEMEGYLLGKRRIDGLIKGTEHKKLEKSASVDTFMALQNANTVRDTAAKIREDPLLAIKRQEQAAYEAMVNDPVRRRQLLKAAGAVDDKKSNIGHKDGEHRRRRREDEDDGGRHRSHKRRRRASDDDRHDDRRRGQRYRSPSFSSSGSRSDSRNRSRRHEQSRYEYEHGRRWPSNYHNSPGRSSSPRRNDHRSYDGPRRRSYSPSPPRHSSKRHHSYTDSNGQRGLNDSSHYHQHRHQDNRRHQGNRDKHDSQPGNSSSANTHTPSAEEEAAERARKLEAMQSDALKLDRDRDERLAAIKRRERADLEADESARMRSARYGAKGDFVTRLNRQAGDMDLAERVRRGRGGMQGGREPE